MQNVKNSSIIVGNGNTGNAKSPIQQEIEHVCELARNKLKDPEFSDGPLGELFITKIDRVLELVTRNSMKGDVVETVHLVDDLVSIISEFIAMCEVEEEEIEELSNKKRKRNQFIDDECEE
nr:MAG TPA: hypothetical protein [Cressdnaviricota sp.]